MEINSRMQASAKSLKIYWNGKPCKHGHSSGRYVSTNACVACQNAANATAKTGYSTKLVVARVTGTVDVVVQVPPGQEDTVRAYAAALVMQRDGERQSNMVAMIKEGPAGRLDQITANPAATYQKKIDKFFPPSQRVLREEAMYESLDTTGIPHHTKVLEQLK